MNEGKGTETLWNKKLCNFDDINSICVRFYAEQE